MNHYDFSIEASELGLGKTFEGLVPIIGLNREGKMASKYTVDVILPLWHTIN